MRNQVFIFPTQGSQCFEPGEAVQHWGVSSCPPAHGLGRSCKSNSPPAFRHPGMCPQSAQRFPHSELLLHLSLFPWWPHLILPAWLAPFSMHNVGKGQLPNMFAQFCGHLKAQKTPSLPNAHSIFPLGSEPDNWAKQSCLCHQKISPKWRSGKSRWGFGQAGSGRKKGKTKQKGKEGLLN